MMKFSPLSVVVLDKGFHINLMFFFILYFFYCVIDLNISFKKLNGT